MLMSKNHSDSSSISSGSNNWSSAKFKLLWSKPMCPSTFNTRPLHVNGNRPCEWRPWCWGGSTRTTRYQGGVKQPHAQISPYHLETTPSPTQQQAWRIQQCQVNGAPRLTNFRLLPWVQGLLSYLAVQWDVQKCRLYLLGIHFDVIVDHKPLVGVVKVSDLDAAIDCPHLQQIVEKLSAYTLTIYWVPGKKHKSLMHCLDQCSFMKMKLNLILNMTRTLIQLSIAYPRLPS